MAFANCHYYPPFDSQKSFRVIQGFDGKYSHLPPLQYGIDFDMPVGTLIRAARDGVVTMIKQDSNRGGPHKKFLRDSNKVVIEHSDGSKTLYAHLKYNSLRVTKGQQVKAGLPIGRSGCTGWCDGPHLHFEVFKGKSSSERTSVPFTFKTKSGCTVPKLGANISYEFSK